MNKIKKDIMVAVRMPRGLVEELRQLQKINHFMDLSDEIRHTIRKYLITPKTTEDKFLETKKKQKIIENLNEMIDTLENEK